MRPLLPLDEIKLPESKAPQPYSIKLHDRPFNFRDLKHVLGAADICKAGDRKAGLAAENEVMREAARALLSNMTLQHLFDQPLTTAQGNIDSVMRINYDIDQAVFADIASLTLGELKDDLLRANGERIRQVGSALTGVMVAALTKLLDTHELIFLAKKLKRGATSKARTVVGLPDTLSSRLQPNHPTDDLRGGGVLANVDRYMVRQVDSNAFRVKAGATVCVLCGHHSHPTKAMSRTIAPITQHTNTTDLSEVGMGSYCSTSGARWW
jgi:ethanolamine ammonia-lyase large subunit